MRDVRIDFDFLLFSFFFRLVLHAQFSGDFLFGFYAFSVATATKTAETIGNESCIFGYTAQVRPTNYARCENEAEPKHAGMELRTNGVKF